ncbi:hypothetical protein [Ancylomarina sp. 16SWW S1-10-2]|uniref:hypothetical protein n=1 Tax=Ancylomarina sp. 16SWW S1-10-2 TaxID=2499681 RepID=UPI0012ADC754|nr:hypothetical protein [Ancylomarina sp. 16SWW S1-10-2]
MCLIQFDMEWKNNFTFEYEATMNRLYIYFSDLLDKELEAKDNADCKHVEKQTDNE